MQFEYTNYTRLTNYKPLYIEKHMFLTLSTKGNEFISKKSYVTQTLIFCSVHASLFNSIWRLKIFQTFDQYGVTCKHDYARVMVVHQTSYWMIMLINYMQYNGVVKYGVAHQPERSAKFYCISLADPEYSSLIIPYNSCQLQFFLLFGAN